MSDILLCTVISIPGANLPTSQAFQAEKTFSPA